ncbi:hypothetical protein ACEXQB_010130 [Herbiconiux sp. P18]|uniref:hypothetical protein n=1 Tax=Herbiconiux liangxiaofengii TaxID=3342795 RepID=UPI0035BB12B2
MSALTTPPAAESDPALYPDAPALPPLQPGDVVSFYAATAVLMNPRMGATGTPVSYGSELTLTPQFFEANPPGQRGSVWELIDDEAGQIDRYGTVVVRRGPWPAGQLRTPEGSPERDAERKALEAKAWRTYGTESAEAFEAIRLVHAVYGRPPATNRSTPTVGLR